MLFHHIKQSVSILLQLCSVKDHRTCQNIITSVIFCSASWTTFFFLITYDVICDTFFSLSHLMSSVIYHWTDAQQNRNYFFKQSSDLYKTTTFSHLLVSFTPDWLSQWSSTCFSFWQSKLLVIVCWARRNCTSLNWPVWPIYVLTQQKKLRPWFQGECLPFRP